MGGGLIHKKSREVPALRALCKLAFQFLNVVLVSINLFAKSVYVPGESGKSGRYDSVQVIKFCDDEKNNHGGASLQVFLRCIGF